MKTVGFVGLGNMGSAGLRTSADRHAVVARRLRAARAAGATTWPPGYGALRPVSC
jgi:3-hydroxyisobutyrate dehydrogenase-like beta-hydroxyacid dehydrogenase